MTDDPVADLTPIDGGYCVDVLRMVYNWRLVVTSRPADEPQHGHCGIIAGWCYFGHGHSEDGRARTMASAHLAAVTAATAELLAQDQRH